MLSSARSQKSILSANISPSYLAITFHRLIQDEISRMRARYNARRNRRTEVESAPCPTKRVRARVHTAILKLNSRRNRNHVNPNRWGGNAASFHHLFHKSHSGERFARARHIRPVSSPTTTTTTTTLEMLRGFSTQRDSLISYLHSSPTGREVISIPRYAAFPSR